MNSLARDLTHILNHTKGLWEELRGQRIFVTGGTGFLGCWMMESLLWANDRLGLNAKVTVLTREPEAFLQKAPHIVGHPSVTLLKGDVRSFGYPVKEYSHILHMATDESHRLTVKDKILMLDTIKDGTAHTLEFARFCGAKKFLFFSSGAVYGEQPVWLKNIPEDYKDDDYNSNPYIRGKRIAERLCEIYGKQYGIETKIARGFCFVGAYLPLDIHYAIGNFIRDTVQRKEITVTSNGASVRSYMYVADAAVWFWNILFKGKGVYNVGSEQALTIMELANLISGLSIPPTPIRVVGIQDGASKRYVPSTKRACDELGLHQYIDLKEAIKKTMEWYENVKRIRTPVCI